MMFLYDFKSYHEAFYYLNQIKIGTMKLQFNYMIFINTFIITEFQRIVLSQKKTP